MSTTTTMTTRETDAISGVSVHRLTWAQLMREVYTHPMSLSYLGDAMIHLSDVDREDIIDGATWVRCLHGELNYEFQCSPSVMQLVYGEVVKCLTEMEQANRLLWGDTELVIDSGSEAALMPKLPLAAV